MNTADQGRVSLELTPDEAVIVVAALRRYEPYWPGDLPERSVAELLSEIRTAIDRVTQTLSVGATTV